MRLWTKAHRYPPKAHRGRTTIRSGRRLARGERFLRTPGIRPNLQPAPAGAVGLPKTPSPTEFRIYFWSSSPAGAGHFLGITQGFAQGAHPWLISSHPSGV